MPAAYFRETPSVFDEASFPGPSGEILGRRTIAGFDLIPVTARDYDRPDAFPYDADIRRINTRSNTEAMIGYVLRADRRRPDELAASGFLPQCVTTDEPVIPALRDHALTFALHSEGRTHQGFVSTTSNERVADRYATYRDLATGALRRAYVYAMLLEGGYDVGRPNSAEIVAPGGIPWRNVVAYVDPGSDRILVRRGFPRFDPRAWRALYRRLSHLRGDEAG